VQDQLLQLQHLVQQLQDAGAAQQMPAQAQQLLQDHQQLLQSAQRSSAITSTSSSNSSSAQLPPPPLQQQPLQQEAQQHPQSQQQLSLQEQQQQLDWESIVDFPHGSLRLLGSCKGPWMDGDPEWVTEKAYSPVQCADGVWMRQPLTLAAIMECSIQLQEGELRVFEQTEEFLEVVFQVGQIRWPTKQSS
jgi:exonuclease VII large subunit